VRRHLPSPALIVACLALGIALGGTSYAAIEQLAPNSVGRAQLKNNAVTSTKVANRSLRAIDFARGQIPRGPAGPQGPAGPTGPAGPAGPAGPGGGSTIRWAAVRADGGIAAGTSGVTLAAKPSAGQYLVNIGASAAGKLVIASSGYAGNHVSNRGETSAGPCGNPSDGLTCATSDNNNTVLVQTRSPAGVLEDHAFYVAVIG
jgi:hypothetical protein